MNYGFLHDNFGNKSSKRLIGVIGALVGYTIAIIVAIIGIFYQIKSPSVVSDIVISVIGAPMLALISTIFEKRRKDE